MLYYFFIYVFLKFNKSYNKYISLQNKFSIFLPDLNLLPELNIIY